MRVYASIITLTLTVSACAPTKLNQAEPITRAEIEQAISAIWHVKWDAKGCMDADLSGFIEGRCASICLRISCPEESSRAVAEQIMQSFPHVFITSSANTQEEQFQIAYVCEKIKQIALPDWDISKCTHFGYLGNTCVAWYSDEANRSSVAYLFEAGVDANTAIVKGLVSGSVQSEISDGLIPPPRVARIVRRGFRSSGNCAGPAEAKITNPQN